MTQMTRMNAPYALQAVAAALGLWCGLAGAVEIDLDNPDLKIRWDNTVRYNLGQRVEKQDSRILASPSYDESDAKFAKGKIVTNRLDLLSEVDVRYKSAFGVRVVGAAWYDNAYDNHSVTSPAAGGVIPTSYYNNTYSGNVSRYVNGPSAEFLDAFVWGNANLGDIPVNVKVGRHTIVWGEGLLIGGQAISYSQAPVDGVKAVASPGIETKEVFLPLNQVSFKAQVTNDLTLAGQYFLQWEPTRVPNGGTYLMGADTSPYVDQLGAAPGFALARTSPYEPGKTGNWGLSARLNVEAIDSVVGLYFRKFNDYNPETGIQFLGTTPQAPGPFRFVYARNETLIGLSLARSIGPVSFGSELSYRKDATLNSKTTYNFLENTGARGDTLHAVVNGVYLMPKTVLWDTGSIIGELAYSHLAKVTENPTLYRGVGYGGCIKSGTGSGGVPAQAGAITDACSTRDFLQAAVNFTPQYLAVLPSWDLDLPMSINYGLHGTAPTGGGGFNKLMTWSIGAKMTLNQRHEFSLRYSDLSVPTKYNAAGTAAIGGNALGSSVGATDRGWIVFTYKTSL